MATRRFSVRDWHFIDAAMDNTAAVAIGIDDEQAGLAREVRRRGWHASRTHSQAGEGDLGWPPLDADLTIDLEPATWAFIREQVERWAEVSRGIVDDPRLDESARREQARSIAMSETVLARLGAAD